MKTLTVVLVVIVFGIQISGYLIQVPTAPPVLFRDPGEFIILNICNILNG